MSNEITSTTTASSVSLSTGKESAPAGFRLVRTSWKQTTDKAGKVTPARKAVSCTVPVTAIAVEPQALQDALQGAFNEMQEDRKSTRLNSSHRH